MGFFLAAPVEAEALGVDVRAGGWPRGWNEREPLLTLQHDRLEAQLAALITAHSDGASPWTNAEALAWDASVRRLIWDLRLHLRLEERWLDQAGSLCPGHRAAHAEALSSVLCSFALSFGERQARTRLLRELRAWFQAHRFGADATAYALAAQQP